MDWSIFDFVLAAVLLGGSALLLRLALRNPGSVVYLAAAASVGVAATALGEADDAPGLVLFGLLLFCAAVAMKFRRARTSA